MERQVIKENMRSDTDCHWYKISSSFLFTMNNLSCKQTDCVLVNIVGIRIDCNVLLLIELPITLIVQLPLSFLKSKI